MALGEALIGPDRVAVVTGAASGIGFGLSERFASEAMSVVMADVEAPALERAAAQLSEAGARVLPVVTDVSNADAVDALRDAALSAFGAVDILCNNAGVGGPPRDPLWSISKTDWDWVLGVNLGGVINGIGSFVPLLLDQGRGHIVNTASIFGVFAGSIGPYGVSKHGIVALTETLYFQLKERDAPIGVSVLCPGAVRTNFPDSARNHPSGARSTTGQSAQDLAFAETMRGLIASGMEPAAVAELVIDAIRTGRFYVLTSSNRNASVLKRAEEILAGGPPTLPFG